MLNREAVVHEVEECLRILADKAGEIPTTGYAWDYKDSLRQWTTRHGEKKPLRALARLVLLLEPGTTITIRK